MLYVRATRILAGRGYRVPALQQVAWFGGLGLMGVALLSPLDSLGETDLLSAHMAQHLLIADLSAPLLVIGLRSPVYAFVLPRSLFSAIARSQRLRAAFRFVKQPWIAAPLWILTLYGWHLAPAYEAALRSPVLHALQHQTFIAVSVLVWLSVLEPARRRVPGELWKIAHIVGVRFAGMFLGMAFVILQRPIYEGFYGQRALEHGLTPAGDQQIAGGLMLAIDFLVMVGALVFFFLRAAEDAERAEQSAGAAEGAGPADREMSAAPKPTAARLGGP
ncbi:MAG: cytochrome c oxidase assembly protein [Solirubrobacterales bacterium]